jgi:hypothetical protein
MKPSRERLRSLTIHGSQLRGDPVAHKPELCCKAQRQRRRRHQGQLIQAWPQWRPAVGCHPPRERNLEKPRARV